MIPSSGLETLTDSALFRTGTSKAYASNPSHKVGPSVPALYVTEI